MHGLNQYDYGARNYDPLLCRFTQIDPLCEKYYDLNPYAYCGNNPVNAIDEEGKLAIFINGFHFGDGGKSIYWNGIDNKIVQHFNETKAPIYYDGSHGGLLGLLPMTLGNQVSLNLHTETFRPSNFYASTRYNMGYQVGKQAAATIFASLTRDKTGKITEVIRIFSHSMGGAFAKGYAQALMDYIQEHPDLTNGASLVEYDFAPYQPEAQQAVNGVDTYQYSHHYDRIAHDGKIKGAHYNTSYNQNKGHSISDFLSLVSQLPEGYYEVENGQIVRRR
jgi:hypothetical protein